MEGERERTSGLTPLPMPGGVGGESGREASPARAGRTGSRNEWRTRSKRRDAPGQQAGLPRGATPTPPQTGAGNHCNYCRLILR